MRPIVCLAILAFSFGCKAKQEVSEEVKKPSSEIPVEYIGEQKWSIVKPELVKLTLFAIKRGPCYGECPVYELNISNTGRVSMNAKKFMAIEGIHQTQLSKVQLEQLEKRIADLNYMDLENKYDNPQVTDVPTTQLFFNTGKPKEIEMRMGAPESVIDFLNWVEPLLMEIEYEKLEVD